MCQRLYIACPVWSAAIIAAATVIAVPSRLLCASENVPPAVTVRNADGSVYGVLRLSAAGDSLLLSWQGQELALGECVDEEIQRVRCPQGIEAIVHDRNCGATVDFARRIVIRDEGQTHVVAIFEGRPHVAVIWSAGMLQVTHSPVPSDRVFRRDESAGPHRIVYSAEGEAVPPTQYVDYASFNYAATGRAAGLPLELLQRAAGWAQEASGLHRTQWARWFGDYPYGDDARGRAKIKEGAEYYEKEYRSKSRE